MRLKSNLKLSAKQQTYLRKNVGSVFMAFKVVLRNDN